MNVTSMMKIRSNGLSNRHKRFGISLGKIHDDWTKNPWKELLVLIQNSAITGERSQTESQTDS
jgi:hypothetical protein